MINPVESGTTHGGSHALEVRNDFTRLADQIILDQPEYAPGAESVKRFISALTEKDFLPKEVVLQSGVDSTLPSQLVEIKKREPYVHPKFEYDWNLMNLKMNGNGVYLTPYERKVLELFIENPNLVISNNEIQKRVWRISDGSGEAGVRVYVAYLRNKFKEAGVADIIKNKWKEGYYLEDESKLSAGENE